MLSLASSPSPAASAPAGDGRYAIVIGQNLSDDDGVEALHYADDDAAAMTELLEDAGVTVSLLARFDADTAARRRARVPDAPPTRAALLAALADVKARAAAGPTELYFVFSGHGGVKHGDGYLVLEDGRLTRDELYARLFDAGVADVTHVIVDACQSYFAVFPKGAGKRERARASFLQAPPASTGFVLSTSSDKESHEAERFAGGVFSVEVRAALRGADVDGDGAITYAELGAFVATANRGIDNARYAPDPYVRAPSSSPVLLRWPAGADTLAFDDGSAGHVAIEDAHGDRVADVNAAAGYAPLLRIPKERPLFLRRENEERVLVDAGSARMSELAPHVAQAIRPRGPADLELARVFSVPFGKDDVEAFLAAPPPPVPEDPPDPLAAVGVSAVGVAAAGLFVASVSTALALDVHDGGLDKDNAERARRNDAIDALNTVTAAACVVGGAAFVGAVVALAWRADE